MNFITKYCLKTNNSNWKEQLLLGISSGVQCMAIVNIWEIVAYMSQCFKKAGAQKVVT